MEEFQVNVLAILVAAVAAFALGALWYSPVLFAKQWMKAHGYTPDKLEAMKKRMGRAYGVSFVCFLVMAAAMAILIHRLDVGSVFGGIKLGGLCWVGFAATISLTANMYTDKPLSTYVIDAGYQLVYMVIMGIIVAVWH
jgi:Protein of unknown function (DUF1761)